MVHCFSNYKFWNKRSMTIISNKLLVMYLSVFHIHHRTIIRALAKSWNPWKSYTTRSCAAHTGSQSFLRFVHNAPSAINMILEEESIWLAKVVFVKIFFSYLAGDCIRGSEKRRNVVMSTCHAQEFWFWALVVLLH